VVKNIARPIHAYRVRFEGVEHTAVAPRTVAPRSPRAPRLSIVVLPFANVSNDPEQEYFADGITGDLTSDLSRISGSFVIARTPTPRDSRAPRTPAP
jgi:TolB-like protein